MSLRDFHVVFIILAILCSGGFWFWAEHDQTSAKEMHAQVLANLSGSLALILIGYGLWFVIKKSRTIRVN